MEIAVRNYPDYFWEFWRHHLVQATKNSHWAGKVNELTGTQRSKSVSHLPLCRLKHRNLKLWAGRQTWRDYQDATVELVAKHNSTNSWPRTLVICQREWTPSMKHNHEWITLKGKNPERPAPTHPLTATSDGQKNRFFRGQSPSHYLPTQFFSAI